MVCIPRSSQPSNTLEKIALDGAIQSEFNFVVYFTYYWMHVHALYILSEIFKSKTLDFVTDLRNLTLSASLCQRPFLDFTRKILR